MITIVGKRNTSFQPKDSSSPVVGTTFYYTEVLTSEGATGCLADRFFLSAAKIKAMGFTPQVGDVCELLFSRWGKVSEVRRVDIDSEIIE